jgi:transposase
VWRKRRWVCPDRGCPVGSFVEQDDRIASPRAKLTRRACLWSIEQIRREHASVNGVRRQLGMGGRTVWESIKPLLTAADLDQARCGGVSILGVDEHVWHHVSTKPVEDGGLLVDRPEGVDRDGRPDPRCQRTHQGSAAGSGPGPFRRGLQGVAV